MPRPRAQNGKSERLTIAVDEELGRQIRDAAKQESMPVSVLLRRFVIEGLRRLRKEHEE